MIKKRLLILLMFVFLTSIPKLSYAFDMTCLFRGVGYLYEVSQLIDAYEGFKHIVSNEKEEEKEQEMKD